jgi:hypothetical protein
MAVQSAARLLDSIMVAVRCSFVLAIALLCGCEGQPASSASTPPASTQSTAIERPANLAKTEFVMVPGQTITATTPVGTIEIYADDWLKRSYTWEGATRSVVMWPRDKRWDGSLGVYFPGPGRHWKEHHGITRGCVDEGQRHFPSEDDAAFWIQSQIRMYGMPYVCSRDGLVVGWMKVPEREQLDVSVWQIMVNGKKPTTMPGATDGPIRVSRP